MTRDIRIVVIGKPNLLRDGLCALLRAQEGIQAVTVMEGQVETMESVDLTAIPDVAVMHLAVVTQSGLDTVAAVRSRWPGARVIALTPRLDGRTVRMAAAAGIDGCISEGDSHTDLLAAIRTVANGERYVTRPVGNPDVSAVGVLTEREKEVTRLIAAGYRTREIAHQLSLSDKTIEKHRANIMRKLGLRSAAAVAAYAIAHGNLLL